MTNGTENQLLVEPVAKLIEQRLDSLASAKFVTAFLRGRLPVPDPDDLVPGGASHGFDEHW